MQNRGGGGFMQTALSTAAGVAGGMMIANALSHAFSGEANPAEAGQSALADLGNDQGGGAENAGISDSLYGNSDQSPGDFSDFGGSGDDGDWA